MNSVNILKRNPWRNVDKSQFFHRCWFFYCVRHFDLVTIKACWWCNTFVRGYMIGLYWWLPKEKTVTIRSNSWYSPWLLSAIQAFALKTITQTSAPSLAINLSPVEELEIPLLSQAAILIPLSLKQLWKADNLQGILISLFPLECFCSYLTQDWKWKEVLTPKLLSLLHLCYMISHFNWFTEALMQRGSWRLKERKVCLIPGRHWAN